MALNRLAAKELHTHGVTERARPYEMALHNENDGPVQGLPVARAWAGRAAHDGCLGT